MSTYPSYAHQSSNGFSLRASKDLEINEVAERFKPKDDIIFENYCEVPEDEVQYVLNFLASDGLWKWLIPLKNARYANHSCEPNCEINERLEIVTIKKVLKDEELTFLYNHGSSEDYWDPRWTFQCRCGMPTCQGIIDRYRNIRSNK
ncbi:SET domain-containing protein [Rozella allomycis CSF55]|uniref:SET domain-containing protein n=1 Tax=Rozella allomycis (strain CSF55) TaxID=988480 RepID=A0A075B2P7_ROZAC|nr:hypothetical protein O9G_000632 [Rozella allomycis CSF55]RKP20778.1 SET domain-containing protein [Rozella allomycis CSF55]|eukprot:EPZ35236.1 hypothetical protein O9G_000632 [Rozella allomycis CSF55]